MLLTVLCYRQSCATDSPVLQTVLCYRQFCVANSYVLRTVLCYRQSCVPDSPVLQIVRCYRQSFSAYSPMLQTILYYRQTSSTENPMFLTFLCSWQCYVTDRLMLQTVLSYRQSYSRDSPILECGQREQVRPEARHYGGRRGGSWHPTAVNDGQTAARAVRGEIGVNTGSVCCDSVNPGGWGRKSHLQVQGLTVILHSPAFPGEYIDIYWSALSIINTAVTRQSMVFYSLSVTK